jgi:hypothetical protein
LEDDLMGSVEKIALILVGVIGAATMILTAVGII